LLTCRALKRIWESKARAESSPQWSVALLFSVIPAIKLCSITLPSIVAFLNQIEIWLSILVRKLLKRGSFASVEDLQAKALAFIDYYNRTMAKPFKWTFQGKALMI
jgi:hypothetical protein